MDSLFETFGGLGQGVPLLIVPRSVRADPFLMLQALQEFDVSRLVLVPSLLRALLDMHGEGEQRRTFGNVLPALRYLSCSGEALPWTLLHDFFAEPTTTKTNITTTAPTTTTATTQLTLLNLYGSTEIAGDVTCAVFTRGGGTLKSSSYRATQYEHENEPAGGGGKQADQKKEEVGRGGDVQREDKLTITADIGKPISNCQVLVLDPVTLQVRAPG